MRLRSKRLEKVYFSIIKLLSDGKSPTDICFEFNWSKQRLNRYLRRLKEENIIEKIGYGVWKVNAKRSKQIEVGRSRNEVRGHGFMFKLFLPKIHKWKDRITYLEKHNIKYEFKNSGQLIYINDRKVHLFNDSIIIYDKESYISSLASESKQKAIYHFLSMIKRLENLFKINLKINKNYRFNVCREHYGLIDNLLAKDYNSKHKKLIVKDEWGIYLIIDNSFNLHELETHKNRNPKESQAVDDSEGVQDFFNSLKRTNYKATPEFLLDLIMGVTSNQVVFDKNMKSHIKAVQDLGKGVNELRELIKRLNNG